VRSDQGTARRAAQAAVDGLPEVAEAQAQTLEGELAELRCNVQTLAEHAVGRGAMEARPCLYHHQGRRAPML